MNPAVFIDRDGTLIKDKDYLDEPDNIEWFPGVFEALKKLEEVGFSLVVVTNQSGVARGYFDEETVWAVNEKFKQKLSVEGVELTDIYYCPSHPEAIEEKYRSNLHLRKPAPGMLEQATEEHNFDPSKSFMVGDKLSDVECGVRFGCRTVLVETGKNVVVPGDSGNSNQQPDFVTPDFPGAARWIINSVK